MTQTSPIPPSRFVTPTEVRATYPRLRAEVHREQFTRRPTPQGGIAIEILGHAIEYLVDTNFYHQRSNLPAVKEAIVILKQSSRDVFADAPVVLPTSSRAVRWIRSRLPAQDAVPVIQPAASARLILVKR